MQRIGFLFFLVVGLWGCGSHFKTVTTVPSTTPVTLPTGDKTVQIDWTAPSTGAPDSYIVEASPDGTNFLQVGTAIGSATSAQIANLGSGNYWFRVTAINSVAQTISKQLTFTVP